MSIRSNSRRLIGCRVKRKDRPKKSLETARYHLNGFVCEELEVSVDKGYVLWLNPRGRADLVFKYMDTGYDFFLHMDPQFDGVEIFELYGCKSRLVYNGIDDLSPIGGIYLGCPKFTQDQILQLHSINGEIRLRLETLPEKLQKNQIIETLNAFKINYTMSL